MRKGFIFNYNKCVNCSACMASCVLENGWTINPRTVYTYNSEALSSMPVINFSLACNHCNEPVCLKGCPAGSYFREPVTGAIAIDDSKCIGCRYCQWSCPYDAPKFDDRKRIIFKCNLCSSGLTEGRLPACTNACPTGALNFGEISVTLPENTPEWFPDKQLGPLIELTGKYNKIPLKIIPEKAFETEVKESEENGKNITGEWSLVCFSFLVTLSVSSIVSSLIRGDFPNLYFFIAVIFLSGIVSLLHLGRASGAWRSISNLKTSPLSREIAIFIIYSSVSLLAVFLQLPLFLIASSAIGLIMLAAIDNVYVYAGRNKSLIFHSGQTFLSSLLIISFFTESIIPFIFIALIKIVLTLIHLVKTRYNDNFPSLRFLRLALLFIAGTSLITGISYGTRFTGFLFITGELFDRINFYYDFKPLNIRTSINDHLIIGKYEEEGG